ncbi:hypothetical protein JCM5353_004416 [Sporobolomyces roseus]
MSTLTHLGQAIERLTPLSLAESSWDNVGLMIEAPRPNQLPKRSITVCIDLTRPVVEAALAKESTSAILTYHPPIFSGLKSITMSNSIQRSLLECATKGVSVYTIHTAADNAVGGVNDYMGTGLLRAAGIDGLEQGELVRPGQGRGLRALKEHSNPPKGHEGCGGGRIVDLKEGAGKGLGREEMVNAVKETLGLKHFQAAWSPTGPSTISTIGICAGSGSSVLKGVKADLYLTGEMSHHDVLAANAQGIHVFCCNHTNTERPWLSSFAPRLQDELNRLAKEEKGENGELEYEVVVSKEDREPLEVV